MLSVSNVSRRIGDLLLFENVNFTINNHDRTAIVGANGAGISTLLRILAGEIQPDTGDAQIQPGTRVGYLRQGFADSPDGTLADVLDVPTQGLYRAVRNLEASTQALGDRDIDLDTATTEFEEATDHFEALGGYLLVAEIESLLDQFGLGNIPLDRAVSQLSGGQKTRAGLAALLATKPDLLILDEPTNHLDASALEWLQEFLRAYRGAVVIVSHDRSFLDETVNNIIAIDPRTHSVQEYAGNYSDYVETRAHEAEEAEAAWHRQQVKVAKMQRDIDAAEQKSRTIENNTIDFAIRKKAAKIARPAVVRKKKIERLLNAEDAAARPERSWGMSLEFAQPVGGARDVIVTQDLVVGYGDQPILNNLDLIARNGDRVAITGGNGTGKTTLLRTISGDLAPVSGSVRRGPGVAFGYLSQEQETLNPSLTVLEQAAITVNASETEIRNELHKFLFGGHTVHKRVADLSYGERTRLMLALLVLNRTTVLMLDEPLNHLDIDAREEFEQALLQFNGTMLMVLHDRYAIDRLATREWLVADGTVADIAMSEVST